MDALIMISPRLNPGSSKWLAQTSVGAIDLLIEVPKKATRNIPRTITSREVGFKVFIVPNFKLDLMADGARRVRSFGIAKSGVVAVH